MVKANYAGIRVAAGGSAVPYGFHRLRVDHLAVGRKRLWRAPSSAPGALLGHVALYRHSSDLRFLLPQHAGHQPRHLHRRLRTEIDGCALADFLAAYLDQPVA